MSEFIVEGYRAVLDKDADSAFGVTFPDLPGCFSAADTVEDIIPNSLEALSLWFEDNDSPHNEIEWRR